MRNEDMLTIRDLQLIIRLLENEKAKTDNPDERRHIEVILAKINSRELL